MRAFSEGDMTSLKKEKEESLNNATTNLCLLRRLEAMVGDGQGREIECLQSAT